MLKLLWPRIKLRAWTLPLFDQVGLIERLNFLFQILRRNVIFLIFIRIA